MSTNNNEQWNQLHQHYARQDWIEKPNIFAEEAAGYFPERGDILCLGDGQGQDGRYFASRGYRVLSTDISDRALALNAQKNQERGLGNIVTQALDLRGPFPHAEAAFDVVYAHLSLHYFAEDVTRRIFGEVRRVLRPGGIFAAFVNSVNDPEFNTGKRIEQELFEIDGVTKRFFSKYSMAYFAADFQPVLLDDLGRTYKDDAAGVHHLVRFIGRRTYPPGPLP